MKMKSLVPLKPNLYININNMNAFFYTEQPENQYHVNIIWASGKENLFLVDHDDFLMFLDAITRAEL